MADIRQRILTQPNLTVVCAGDSQVWGEGARGWLPAMPDVVAGDMRRLPESVPSFVALLSRSFRDLRPPDSKTLVINSGVGSTAVTKYYTQFWLPMVLAHQPDVVVVMSAINDWLYDRNVSLADYRRTLTQMINDVHQQGAEFVLLTESPILGTQFSENHYYDDYIALSRQVAQANPRVLLADANQRMKDWLAAGDYERNAAWLYEDNWHVTQLGQLIYFKTITDTLGL
jgi:lysophospholipase L1-like esterase